jgi:hypothetical protein
VVPSNSFPLAESAWASAFHICMAADTAALSDTRATRVNLARRHLLRERRLAKHARPILLRVRQRVYRACCCVGAPGGDAAGKYEYVASAAVVSGVLRGSASARKTSRTVGWRARLTRQGEARRGRASARRVGWAVRNVLSKSRLRTLDDKSLQNSHYQNSSSATERGPLVIFLTFVKARRQEIACTIGQNNPPINSSSEQKLVFRKALSEFLRNPVFSKLVSNAGGVWRRNAFGVWTLTKGRAA